MHGAPSSNEKYQDDKRQLNVIAQAIAGSCSIQSFERPLLMQPSVRKTIKIV
jgi:hypothetical protein